MGLGKLNPGCNNCGCEPSQCCLAVYLRSIDRPFDFSRNICCNHQRFYLYARSTCGDVVLNGVSLGSGEIGSLPNNLGSPFDQNLARCLTCTDPLLTESGFEIPTKIGTNNVSVACCDGDLSCSFANDRCCPYMTVELPSFPGITTSYHQTIGLDKYDFDLVLGSFAGGTAPGFDYCDPRQWPIRSAGFSMTCSRTSTATPYTYHKTCSGTAIFTFVPIVTFNCVHPGTVYNPRMPLVFTGTCREFGVGIGGPFDNTVEFPGVLAIPHLSAFSISGISQITGNCSGEISWSTGWSGNACLGFPLGSSFSGSQSLGVLPYSSC